MTEKVTCLVDHLALTLLEIAVSLLRQIFVDLSLTLTHLVPLFAKALLKPTAC